MKQPQKHAELIKAWADGEAIEVCDDFGEWYQTETPSWADGLNYRIKPEPEPKPDAVVKNLVLTFDETGICGTFKFLEVKDD